MDTDRDFAHRGWCRFAHDARLAAWVAGALPAARAARANPENDRWLRCNKTWFVGVNALDNDADGALANGIPLTGEAVAFIRNTLFPRPFAWDRGQVSICYPGYPDYQGCRAEEGDGAARYRLKRDAAHLDGLLPEGPERRRHLRECHGFILGIPLLDVPAHAAPFVVWEGSHRVAQAMLQKHYAGLPPERWGEVDVTDIYHQARQRIFDSCRRVEIHARPGEAYVVHRLALHGIAPWPANTGGAKDDAGGRERMIIYFRPIFLDPEAWLNGD